MPSRQRGQGLVEYALILALVVIVVIVVLALMGRQIQNAFQDVVNTLQGP
jgi:pilus assembly protein Flp/PilA